MYKLYIKIMILAFYDRYIGVYSLETLISLILAHIDKKNIARFDEI